MIDKPRARKTMEERFANFAGEADENGCLPWTGYRNPAGYGTFYAHGGPKLAHRVAVEIAGGTIPPGMEVDHACHEPSCVNVDHLRVVTGAENKQNRASATRASKSGIRGVWAFNGRWRAVVKLNSQYHYLGLFGTPEEAGKVASDARRTMMPYSEMDKSKC